MKRLKKWIATVCAVLCLAMPAAACTNEMSGKTVLLLWMATNSDIAGAVRAAVMKYNDENTENIYIKYQNKPLNSYGTLIVNSLDAGIVGPDLILVSESNFRNWASRGGGQGYFEDLTPYVEADPTSDVHKIMPAALNRYRYDSKKMTSKATDPLLAVPYDVDATTIIYNVDAIEGQGIKIISVDEEDIEAFNNGAPDNYGKTKADYGITLPVRARGFDRRKADGTNMNYVKGTYNGQGEFVENTEPWQFPAYGADGKLSEVVIFNNRISMSWDEVEDFGRIMSGLTGGTAPNYYLNHENVRPSTDWGYYTEWWFSYGWGVGGDCIVDPTGDGDFEFSLLDTTVRRAVYKQTGDTRDIATDTQVSDPVSGKFKFVEDKGENADYGLADGEYVGPVLPTQRSAFERFFYLQKPKNYGGMYLGPRQVSDIGSSTDLAFFQTGRLALFTTTKSKLLAMRKAVTDFTWDIAPPICYKMYDANGDAAVSRTQAVSLNHTNAMAIWKNSANKDAAYKFLKYYTTGQFQADVAHAGIQCSAVPEQMHEYFVKVNEDNNAAPKNISIFEKCAPNQYLIDIYYFPDEAWLWEWANPLNQQFRENDKSIDEFYNYKPTGSTKPLYESVNDKINGYKELFNR